MSVITGASSLNWTGRALAFEYAAAETVVLSLLSRDAAPSRTKVAAIECRAAIGAETVRTGAIDVRDRNRAWRRGSWISSNAAHPVDLVVANAGVLVKTEGGEIEPADDAYAFVPDPMLTRRTQHGAAAYSAYDGAQEWTDGVDCLRGGLHPVAAFTQLFRQQGGGIELRAVAPGLSGRLWGAGQRGLQRICRDTDDRRHCSTQALQHGGLSVRSSSSERAVWSGIVRRGHVSVCLRDDVPHRWTPARSLEAMAGKPFASCARTGNQSIIATARVQPAAGPSILTGKQRYFEASWPAELPGFPAFSR